MDKNRDGRLATDDLEVAEPNSGMLARFVYIFNSHAVGMDFWITWSLVYLAISVSKIAPTSTFSLKF